MYFFKLENAFSMVKKNEKFHMETIPIGENLFKEEPSEIKGSMTSFLSMIFILNFVSLIIY